MVEGEEFNHSVSINRLTARGGTACSTAPILSIQHGTAPLWLQPKEIAPDSDSDDQSMAGCSAAVELSSTGRLTHSKPYRLIKSHAFTRKYTQ